MLRFFSIFFFVIFRVFLFPDFFYSFFSFFSTIFFSVFAIFYEYFSPIFSRFFSTNFFLEFFFSIFFYIKRNILNFFQQTNIFVAFQFLRRDHHSFVTFTKSRHSSFQSSTVETKTRNSCQCGNHIGNTPVWKFFMQAFFEEFNVTTIFNFKILVIILKKKIKVTLWTELQNVDNVGKNNKNGRGHSGQF